MAEESGKRTRSPDDFLNFDAEAERGPEKAARLEGEEARRPTAVGRSAGEQKRDLMSTAPRRTPWQLCCLI